MRVRAPFAGAFGVLLLLAAYLGLAPKQFEIPGEVQHSDKILHFVTFFLLTGVFYWIIDTSRRRLIHITLVVCTLLLGVASEVVQGLLPNGRDFDLFDIAANVVGSVSALLICAWYHKRILERKRESKRYTSVPGDEETGGAGYGADDLPNPDDMELEEQETGIVNANQTIDDEIDNWDENAEDPWEGEEDDDAHPKTDVQKEEPKKRTD